MEYSDTVKPYLNTNEKLDSLIESLWWNWPELNMQKSFRDFLGAVAISPNIGKLDHYVSHCFQVSRKCE